jgi:hypothetical protein
MARRLVAGFSPWRPGFDSGLARIRFVVAKVALGQFLSENLVLLSQYHSTSALAFQKQCSFSNLIPLDGKALSLIFLFLKVFKKHGHTLEKLIFSQLLTKFPLFNEQDGLLPCLHVLIVPILSHINNNLKSYINFSLLGSFLRIRPSVTFCILLVYYSQKVLAPCSTAKLGFHSLWAVLNYILNILATPLHVWRSSCPPLT